MAFSDEEKREMLSRLLDEEQAGTLSDNNRSVLDRMRSAGIVDRFFPPPPERAPKSEIVPPSPQQAQLDSPNQPESLEEALGLTGPQTGFMAGLGRDPERQGIMSALGSGAGPISRS